MTRTTAAMSFAQEMLWMLDRRVGGLGLSQVRVPVVKMLLATSLMGALLLAVKMSPIYPTGQTRLTWLTQVALLTTLGAAAYFAVCSMRRSGIASFLRLGLSGRCYCCFTEQDCEDVKPAG